MSDSRAATSSTPPTDATIRAAMRIGEIVTPPASSADMAPTITSPAATLDPQTPRTPLEDRIAVKTPSEAGPDVSSSDMPVARDFKVEVYMPPVATNQVQIANMYSDQLANTSASAVVMSPVQVSQAGASNRPTDQLVDTGSAVVLMSPVQVNSPANKTDAAGYPTDQLVESSSSAAAMSPIPANQVDATNHVADPLIDTTEPSVKEEPSNSPTRAADSVTQPVDEEAREFECAHDSVARCMTGQYNLALSRKVISDHFGRNKACTRMIDFWPLFCRKHYQRATYNNASWQNRKVNLILEQFDKIEQQIPGTKYNVTFKKSEENRINTYSRKVAMGMTEDEAAKSEGVAAQEDGKNFEAPIEVLFHLDHYGHLGKNKSIDEVKDTVEVISNMLADGDTTHVPSIEFLPQLDKNGNPVDLSVPTTTRKTPKKSTKKKATSRVSDKGAITKSSPQKTPTKSKLKAEAAADA